MWCAEGLLMRGRKRQRKKDSKRRGVWGLLVTVTPKRGERDQHIADALARIVDFRIRQDGNFARWIAAGTECFHDGENFAVDVAR
jgi:hypothetical protein